MQFIINIDDNYKDTVIPFTDKSQYFERVMNFACESYMKQYKTTDKVNGLLAAMEEFNVSILEKNTNT